MNNFETALVKEVCPVCCKEYDRAIVMNQILTPGEAKKVKELDGKVVGFSEKPCKECVEAFKGEEGTYLIGIIPEKSGKSINEMFRSGRIIGLSEEGTKRFLDNMESEHRSVYENFINNHGFMFVDNKILDMFKNQ